MTGRTIPKRCKGCVRVNRGREGTPYALWCTAHSKPLHKADPHCRSAPAHDKRVEKQ